MKKSLKSQTWFKFAILALCAVIFFAFSMSTPPEGLEAVGWKTLGILVVVLILFISEAIPHVATCFMILVLLRFSGVMTMKEITTNACSSTLFFSMASYGIGAALKGTNLAPIILRFLYKVTKGESKRMISIVVWLTALISVFVSDGAAQVTVLAIVTAIIAAIGDPEPGTSRLCGGMMMAICVGSLTGGVFLPISNTANVALMDLANTLGGMSVSFFQWAILGVPCGLLLTFVASVALPRYFKPEKLSQEQQEGITKVFESIPEKLQPKDIYYLVLISIMMILWIASNWVKAFDTSTVAMLGMVCMMLPIPKLQLLTPKAYKQNFGSNVVVTILCMFPLAAAMKSSGLGEWIVGILFADAANWSTIMIYVAAALTAFIIHLLIPSGNAAGTLAITLMGPIMLGVGVPAAAIAVCIGIQTGTSFLFPLEGLWQYTFGSGHYKFDDCLKAGWSPTLVGLLESALLIPLLVWVFGGLL